MTQIPSGTKFVGIASTVPTPENRSSQNNAFQEVYTLADIQESVLDLTTPPSDGDVLTYDTGTNAPVWAAPSGGSSYKEYVALITQTGTDAPVATVVTNTIGTITWSRQSTGYYKATSSALFTAGKTFINDNGEWAGDATFAKPISNGSINPLVGYMESFVEDTSVCSISFRTPSSGTSEMVNLVGATALMVRIVVYN